MEPYEINLSLVAGTSGTYAVAYSPSRVDWLVCHFDTNRSGEREWLFVESCPTEEGARKLAYAHYARDLAREAAR